MYFLIDWCNKCINVVKNVNVLQYDSVLKSQVIITLNTHDDTKYYEWLLLLLNRVTMALFLLFSKFFTNESADICQWTLVSEERRKNSVKYY